jgi:hypothetical protein
MSGATVDVFVKAEFEIELSRNGSAGVSRYVGID